MPRRRSSMSVPQPRPAAAPGALAARMASAADSTPAAGFSAPAASGVHGPGGGSAAAARPRRGGAAGPGRARGLGVSLSGVLPVLLVLCECTLTAETTFKSGDGAPAPPTAVAAGRLQHSPLRLFTGFVGIPALGRGAPAPAAGSTDQCGSCSLLRGPSLLRGTGGAVARTSVVRLRLGAARSGSSGPGSRAAAEVGKVATQDGASDNAQRSADDVVGDAETYSAQERRMLHVLSKFGRLHTPAAPGQESGDVRKAGFGAGQALREQKEEMAKDRRDEKVALRRGQGSFRPASSEGGAHKVAGFQTRKSSRAGRQADRPGSRTAKEPQPSLESKPVMLSNATDRQAQAQPRFKHASVPTNGILKTRDLAAAPKRPERPERRVPIPHKLANYTSLVALLDVLDPFCEAIGYGFSGGKGISCCCSGSYGKPELSASSVSDAVGALNRLKRLRNQATSKLLEARLSACIECLGKVVMDGMPLLSGKLVSLAINAVAHTRRHTQLMTAAGKRVIEIAKSEDVDGLDVQAVSVIVNGFARAGLRDEAVFRHMSVVALRLIETNRADFGAQAISVIANAFVKVRISDHVLFTRLAETCEHVPHSDFTPQAIANIMNAYARHDNLDCKALFAFLSKVSQQSMPSLWLSRHLSLVVNALAKLDYRDDALLKWIAEAALARPTSSFDVQAISNILNGYGKLYGSAMDRRLLAHMAAALGEMPPRALDPQSVASSLNALVKTGYDEEGRALCKRLSHIALHLDPLLFDAQSVSTIMHSMAKLNLRDTKLFRRMAMVVGQMEYILEPQSIALVINACAKVEYRDEKLMKHLSRIACGLPAETFTPQHVENILNGFARLDIRDAALFKHMAKVVRILPVNAFDSQAVAIIMNSYARVMSQDAVTADVFHFLAHHVLPEVAAVDLQATSLSIILNAFAKAEMRDDEAIARLCSMIVAEDSLLLQGGTGGIPVCEFDGRHIASVLHAVATLHVEQPPALADLMDRLVSLEPHEQQPEEVAIIAWSVAVMNMKRLDVYNWLMRGLDLYIQKLDSNFRRQAHQFLLTCELDGFPGSSDAIDGDWRPSGAVKSRGASGKHAPKLETVRAEGAAKLYRSTERQYEALRSKANQDEVQLDYAASCHRPSRLQRDVALILTELDIEFVEEYVDERSGYSVDMLLSNKRTAIEVDGPSHYAAGTQRPLGNTNMKHRHLAQLGFDLRILPYWEWDKLKNKDQKKAYIKSLLTMTPSVSPSP